MRSTLAIVGAITVIAAGANAQNLIGNPGFEDAGGPSGAAGWGTFNTARLRTVGDGLLPAALVRTGNASFEIVGDGATDFAGFTTNIFDAVNLQFADPEISSPGGDVTVTGWYNIPADRPLVNAVSGIKLEFRRPNSSIWQAFEDNTISGHTDGLWVQYSLTVPGDALDPANNGGDAPTTVSVLPLFFDGTASETGTIFWDDLELTQGEACTLEADRNGDNTTDVLDLLAFLESWFPEQGQSCP